MEALQRLHNRGSISTGYDIDNSYKNEADNTERMYRAWGGSGGGNSQTWTVSLWVKRTELDNQQYIWGAGTGGTNFFLVSFESDNTMRVRSHVSSSDQAVYITNRVFRDTSAWYHIVVAVDTTSGTAGDRLRIYINGVEETSFSTETHFSQNDSTMHNANNSYMEIGTTIGEANRFCGYIAEVISISGSQLAPTTFGKTDSSTGIWIPKEYTGSFPQNSVFLEFKDSSSLGADTSGNSQTFTLQNVSSADQATDTPTNNFATGNPLGPFRVGHWNFTEGATYAQYAGGNDWGSFTSTIAVGSGKWYVEIQAGGSDLFIGAGSEDFNFVGAGSGTGFPEIYYGYTGTNSVGYHANNGNIYNNGSASAIGSTYTTNDIISVALDMDNGKIYFAKNGTYINSQNPATGANSIALPDTSARYFIGGSSYGTGKNHRCNYGGYTSFTISSGASDEDGYGTFEYAPPSGYYALCTKNLEEFG